MESPPFQFELRAGDGTFIDEQSYRFRSGEECRFYDTGHGEALVLVPGLLAGKDSFEHQIRQFSILFRVVAADLTFGIAPPDIVTLNDAAESLRELLDARGIERFSMLGHSLGGSIAIALAAAYPQRIIRLILSSPVTRLTGATLLQKVRRKIDRTNIRFLRRIQGEGAAFLASRYCDRHGLARSPEWPLVPASNSRPPSGLPSVSSNSVFLDSKDLCGPAKEPFPAFA